MGSERQMFRVWAKINISVPVRNQTSVSHSLFCKYHGSFIFIFRPIILTRWSRGLLEKLTVSRLVKKFPACYGTRKFITAFTSARHLSLSCARSIQSVTPRPTSWRAIWILSSQLRLGLPNSLFPSGYPTKNLYARCSPAYVLHAPSISFSIWSPE